MATGRGSRDRRVVVVTGASSGIGRATARAFAADGHHVLGVGRRQAALTQTAADHPRPSTHVADLSDPTQVAATISTAVDRWGGVDVLVNNAGAFALMPVADMTPQRIRDLFDINVVAPSLLVHHAAPSLADRNGVVVNVSSTTARIVAVGAGHYGASKAALEYLTRVWAAELAADGIRVVGVAPGPTESGALAAAGMSPEAIEEVKRREVAAIPLGRRGHPDEISRWIVKLAADDASWITGQILGVDGGLEVA